MTKALRIRDLQKTYPNGFQALKSIDLDVEQGDFFALLGPNGAGKSTTIGIITSLITKSRGSVEVFGHDIDRDLERAKTCIGLVPQEFNFNMFEPVMQIVVNQAGYYGIKRWPRHYGGYCPPLCGAGFYAADGRWRHPDGSGRAPHAEGRSGQGFV